MIPLIVLKILGIANILPDDVESKLNELKTTYPDVADVVQHFGEWLMPQLEAVVDRSAAEGLVKKVVAELFSGAPGYNPNHPGVA